MLKFQASEEPLFQVEFFHCFGSPFFSPRRYFLQELVLKYMQGGREGGVAPKLFKNKIYEIKTCTQWVQLHCRIWWDLIMHKKTTELVEFLVQNENSNIPCWCYREHRFWCYKLLVFLWLDHNYGLSSGLFQPIQCFTEKKLDFAGKLSWFKWKYQAFDSVFFQVVGNSIFAL